SESARTRTRGATRTRGKRRSATDLTRRRRLRPAIPSGRRPFSLSRAEPSRGRSPLRESARGPSGRRTWDPAISSRGDRGREARVRSPEGCADQSGAVLVLALVLSALLTVLGLLFALAAEDEGRMSVNQKRSIQTLYAAEAAARCVRDWFERPDPA